MLELARALGLSLAESDEFAALVLARKNMNEDHALHELLEDFKAKREEVIALMEAGNSDIVEASNDLDALQQQLLDNPLFVDLMNAENDFQILLGSVNEEIAKCLSDADPTGESDYSFVSRDSCAHCSH